MLKGEHMSGFCASVIWLALTSLVIFLKGKTEEKTGKKGFCGFFFF